MHHHGNIGLPIVNVDIYPLQTSHVTDAQSGEAGKHVGFLEKFIRAGSFRHPSDFINGQVFTLAFRLFYLLNRFQQVPRVLADKSLEYRFIERGAECLAVRVPGSRADRLSGSSVLVRVAQPVYQVKTKLLVDFGKLHIGTEHV